MGQGEEEGPLKCTRHMARGAQRQPKSSVIEAGETRLVCLFLKQSFNEVVMSRRKEGIINSIKCKREIQYKKIT